VDIAAFIPTLVISAYERDVSKASSTTLHASFLFLTVSLTFCFPHTMQAWGYAFDGSGALVKSVVPLSCDAALWLLFPHPANPKIVGISDPILLTDLAPTQKMVRQLSQPSTGQAANAS
jgi:hypothetical protein